MSANTPSLPAVAGIGIILGASLLLPGPEDFFAAGGDFLTADFAGADFSRTTPVLLAASGVPEGEASALSASDLFDLSVAFVGPSARMVGTSRKLNASAENTRNITLIMTSPNIATLVASVSPRLETGELDRQVKRASLVVHSPGRHAAGSPGNPWPAGRRGLKTPAIITQAKVKPREIFYFYLLQ